MPLFTDGTGFWFVAAAFAVLMAFGTAPTPLWPLYAARDGFGVTTITVVFAVLVGGAALGFLALGHLSDRLGRRRIVVSALAVTLAAAVALTWWTTLPGLVVGRFLNGVGIGLMASTATTYLHDLYRRAHPDRSRAGLPEVVATAANLGGLALGPLVAGVIAQWVAHPLTVTQFGFAVALAVCLLLTLVSPETVDRTRTARHRPARFALRPGGLPAFVSAAGLGFSSFALFGLVNALGSVILHTELGISSAFVAGLAPFLMFIAAALAQLALAPLPARRLLAVGTMAFPAGLALVALSVYGSTPWLYLGATAVAGAGAGVLFKAGVAQSVTAADPASRAGVLAVYFVVAYAGMGLPTILFSEVIRHVSMQTTMICFAAVLSAVAVLSTTVAVRGRGAGGGDAERV
ncbi:multidrug transporter [Streptomyces hygroscopicus]|uniref:MFS transporter n=1 Tax=Streptomyces hygroscopicus TaxID=1912 RepID=UPI00223FE2A5|nr:MFS transporter [Streptomyces hygroscopicus]MCW7946219.1 multidrug transporter [Streptomyces hygroscopicus]